MARPIDADALVRWLKSPTGFSTNCEDCTSIDCLDCIVEEAINNAPTIEAEHVRHGTWVPLDGTLNVECSECKAVRNTFSQAYWNYCPNCGKPMDGCASDEG